MKKRILGSAYKYVLKTVMEKTEVLQVLQQLGLGNYEARAYTTLALMGPSSANDLSKAAEIPRSKIYDVLESLMRKEMVEFLNERPKKFKAVAPEIAIKGLISEEELKIKSLKERASLLASQLHPLFKEEGIEGIWEQAGGNSIELLNKLAEMMNRAGRYAIDITRDFSFSQALRDAMRSCIKRGVKIKVLCMGINGENYHRALWYHEQKIPIRVFEAKVHPRILVVDGKEVAMRLDSNPASRKFRFHSIWSRDPSFVAVIDSYMKNLWNMARPVDFKKLKVQA